MFGNIVNSTRHAPCCFRVVFFYTKEDTFLCVNFRFRPAGTIFAGDLLSATALFPSGCGSTPLVFLGALVMMPTGSGYVFHIRIYLFISW